MKSNPHASSGRMQFYWCVPCFSEICQDSWMEWSLSHDNVVLNTTRNWGVRGVESSNTFAAAALSPSASLHFFISSHFNKERRRRLKGERKSIKTSFSLSPYSTRTAVESSVCCHVVVKNCKNCRLSYACNSRTFLLFSFDDAGNGKNAPCHLRF